MLNEPGLAILIDCWDVPVNKELNETIINYVDSTPVIGTAVLASYNCKKEFSQDKSIWYTNHRALFTVDTSPRKIRELHHVHFLHMMRDSTYQVEQTDQQVLEYVNPSKFQIAMTWAWQLEYYLSLNRHIKNVYVFGSAWDICVENRPLGYKALTEIEGIRILTNVKCVTDNKLQHPNLDSNPNWVKVDNDTYQYVLGNKKVDD